MYKIAFFLLLLVMVAVLSLVIKVKATDMEVNSPVILGSPILVSTN